MKNPLDFNDFLALSPLLSVLGASLLLLIIESFFEKISNRFSAYIALGAVSVALFFSFFTPVINNPSLTPWLRFDALSHFFTILFLMIGLFSILLSASFFQKFQTSKGEYFFLLLASLFGLILIGEAADFLTLFLGLETLSLSLYVLCGYMKKWEISNESSLKYFLMGSLGAAFLLYGIALIYGSVGSTHFNELLGTYQSADTAAEKALFLSGISLVTVGLAFKAAIVPFHSWAPDVYDGAPTPVTAFMAIGTKLGAFAALILIFLVALPQFDVLWNQAIALLAMVTLIYANIVALRQKQLRRFFAYSGISHAGYLLIPLAAGTSAGLHAILFYFVVYAVATFGSFAVLAFLDTRKEGVLMSDLKGLFHRNPWLATLLSLCLLTLGGIPPTVGFLAKFYLFKIAFQAGHYSLVIVGLLTAVLSAFYYMRIVAIMLSKATGDEEVLDFSWPAGIVGVCSFAGIVLLSCLPGFLFEWVGNH